MSHGVRRAVGTLAVLGAAAFGATAVHADDGNAARELLDRSRESASHNDFRGVIRIEWRDGRRHRSETVPVEVSEGVLRFGDDRLLSVGTRRVLRTASGWRLLWAGPAASGAPDPTRKYDFDVRGGVTVAARAATEVVIDRGGSAVARERLYFDNSSGLLLRRDQLDRFGRVVRRVAFIEVSDPTPVEHFGSSGLPKADRTYLPEATDAQAGAPRGPIRIGDGFRLAGAYRQWDGTMQLFYSDGLIGLSVFEHPGVLAWGDLPRGGHRVELAGQPGRLYATAAGTALVWERDGIVYTAVTDASPADVGLVARDLHRSREPDAIERVGRFLTGPFAWD